MFISLGSNCSVAYNLNKFGIRTNAYPFDWANTKMNQLISVLENNFLNYDTFEIKKLSTIHPNFKINSPESDIGI